MNLLSTVISWNLRLSCHRIHAIQNGLFMVAFSMFILIFPKHNFSEIDQIGCRAVHFDGYTAENAQVIGRMVKCYPGESGWMVKTGSLNGAMSYP